MALLPGTAPWFKHTCHQLGSRATTAAAAAGFQATIREQQLTFADLAERKELIALGRLAGDKDPLVQLHVVAVLLEAAKIGNAGMQLLVAVSGFLHVLFDLVSSATMARGGAPSPRTMTRGKAASPTTPARGESPSPGATPPPATDAGGAVPADDVAGGPLHLLWRLSASEAARQVILQQPQQHLAILVTNLQGHLFSPRLSLRAWASGTLSNLSSSKKLHATLGTGPLVPQLVVLLGQQAEGAAASPEDNEFDVLSKLHSACLLAVLATMVEPAEQLVATPGAFAALSRGLLMIPPSYKLSVLVLRLREMCAQTLSHLLDHPLQPSVAAAAGAELVACAVQASDTELQLLASNPALRRALGVALQHGAAAMAAGTTTATAAPDAFATAAAWTSAQRTAYLSGPCESCLHVLRRMASSPTCAQQLTMADVLVLRHLKTLVYHFLSLSTELLVPADPTVLHTQAVAAGTLAALCMHDSIREVPVVKEALTPAVELLSALTNLLLLPPSGVTANRRYIAALLAAIALYGPYSYAAFTQHIVMSRGALGVIISLLPEVAPPPDASAPSSSSPAAGGGLPPLPSSEGSHHGSKLSARGRVTRSASASAAASASTATTAAAAAAGNAARTAFASSVTCSPAVVEDDSACLGVVASLQLCAVAAASTEISKILAAKTPVLPTLLCILLDRTAIVPSSLYSRHVAGGWQCLLHVLALDLLCAIVWALDETTLRGELLSEQQLLPALMGALASDNQDVQTPALRLILLLLGHASFVRDCLGPDHSTATMRRTMDLLGLMDAATEDADSEDRFAILESPRLFLYACSVVHRLALASPACAEVVITVPGALTALVALLTKLLDEAADASYAMADEPLLCVLHITLLLSILSGGSGTYRVHESSAATTNNAAADNNNNNNNNNNNSNGGASDDAVASCAALEEPQALLPPARVAEVRRWLAGSSTALAALRDCTDAMTCVEASRCRLMSQLVAAAANSSSRSAGGSNNSSLNPGSGGPHASLSWTGEAALTSGACGGASATGTSATTSGTTPASGASRGGASRGRASISLSNSLSTTNLRSIATHSQAQLNSSSPAALTSSMMRLQLPPGRLDSTPTSNRPTGGSGAGGAGGISGNDSLRAGLPSAGFLFNMGGGPSSAMSAAAAHHSSLNNSPMYPGHGFASRQVSPSSQPAGSPLTGLLLSTPNGAGDGGAGLLRSLNRTPDSDGGYGLLSPFSEWAGAGGQGRGRTGGRRGGAGGGMKRSPAAAVAEETRMAAMQTLKHVALWWKSGGHLDIRDVPALLEELAEGSLPQPSGCERSSSAGSAGGEATRSGSKLGAVSQPLPRAPPRLPSVTELSALDSREGRSGHDSSGGAERQTDQVLAIAVLCTRVMAAGERAAQRSEATACLAAVLAISEQLAAYICLSVPAVLERILDVLLLCAREDDRRAAAAIVMSPLHMNNNHNSHNAHNAGSDATLDLQRELQSNAETTVCALSLVLLLSRIALLQSRVANHARLPQVLDAVLEEDSYIQVKTMLEAVRTRSSGRRADTLDPLDAAREMSASTDGGTSQADSPSRSRALRRGETGGTSAGSNGSQRQRRASAAVASLETEEMPDVRIMAAEIIVQVAGHASQPLLLGPGGVLGALDGLLREADARKKAVALQALWALSAMPGGANLIGSVHAGVLRSLVVCLRGPEPAVRLHAAGVIAAVAQNMSKLSSLGAVEGLTSGLVDMMLAATDAVARSGQAAAKLSSGDSLDITLQEAQQLQLLWSMAAIAALSQSAPIAARFASSKGLPAALLVALKFRVADVHLYAAGLIGNLLNHVASQSIIVSTRNIGRELVRALKDCTTLEGTDLITGAIRNLAACDKGRYELASEPLTVPALVKVLTHGNDAVITSGPAALAQQQELKVKAGAALANLSADRLGLEAMVMDQEIVLPALFGSLHALSADGWSATCSGPQARLKCFVVVALSNALSHPVLGKAAMMAGDAVPTLCAFVMQIPCPSERARSSGDPLAGLRSKVQRMTAVSGLESLQQLLGACGPRVLAGTQWHAAVTAAATGGTGGMEAAAAAALAAAAAGGTSAAAGGAGGTGVASSGGSINLPVLVGHVMDLLSWVDFFSGEDVTSADGSIAGVGVDVSGAAAGVLGMLAIHGLAGQFVQYVHTAVDCLVKLLVMPTLQPESTGHQNPTVVDVAAAHAAMALWALTSNPNCQPWALKIGADVSALRVLLLLTRRGQNRGTRSRYNPARIFAASTLGQLACQGLVAESLLPELLHTHNGVIFLLVDLMTLALIPTHPSKARSSTDGGAMVSPGGPISPSAGSPPAGAPANGAPPLPRPPRASAATHHDILESTRSAALNMVGVLGDLRCTLGLQAVGTLAHLAALPGGTAAIVESGARMFDHISRLLTAGIEDVQLAAVMLLATMTSAAAPSGNGSSGTVDGTAAGRYNSGGGGDSPHAAGASGGSPGGGSGCCQTMLRDAGLLAALHRALSSINSQVQAYTAVALGNLALEEGGADKIMTPACVAQLAALIQALPDLVTFMHFKPVVIQALPSPLPKRGGGGAGAGPVPGVSHEASNASCASPNSPTPAGGSNSMLDLPSLANGPLPPLTGGHASVAGLAGSGNRMHGGVGLGGGEGGSGRRGSVVEGDARDVFGQALATACAAAGALQNMTGLPVPASTLLDSGVLLGALTAVLREAPGVQREIVQQGDEARQAGLLAQMQALVGFCAGMLANLAEIEGAKSLILQQAGLLQGLVFLLAAPPHGSAAQLAALGSICNLMSHSATHTAAFSAPSNTVSGPLGQLEGTAQQQASSSADDIGEAEAAQAAEDDGDADTVSSPICSGAAHACVGPRSPSSGATQEGRERLMRLVTLSPGAAASLARWAASPHPAARHMAVWVSTYCSLRSATPPYGTPPATPSTPSPTAVVH